MRLRRAAARSCSCLRSPLAGRGAATRRGPGHADRDRCRASRWRRTGRRRRRPYEIIRGRIHGEVDPADRRNAIIQDLALAPRNARGRVEYVATFALAKPVDLAKASGVLIYSVVNRGNGVAAGVRRRATSWLVSGWQGDLPPAADKQTIAVPVARNADGSPITGRCSRASSNAAPGTTTLPIRLAIDRQPAAGVSARRPRAARRAPDQRRQRDHDRRAARRRARCRAPTGRSPTAARRRFPGTPDPTQLCVKGGFDPTRLYRARPTPRQDPLVLGIGLAATRDIVGVLPPRRRGRAGHAEPGRRRDPPRGRDRRLAVGQLHPDLHPSRLQRRRRRPRDLGRRVPAHRGAADADELPLRRCRAARRAVRAGQRAGDLVGPLRRIGRAGAGAPACSIAAPPRAPARRSIEAFGSAEFWGLRMSPDLVGTDARTDIPLPANVRRYYYPGTTHGGGRGGFASTPPPAPRRLRAARPTRTRRPTRRAR